MYIVFQEYIVNKEQSKTFHCHLVIKLYCTGNMQYFTGFNDVHKICSSEKSSDEKSEMICRLFSSMMKTPKFAIYTNLKMSPALFKVNEAADFVMVVKSLPKTDLVLCRNIVYSLHAVRLVNVVYHRMIEMKSEPISQNNDMHIALLESLWMNMKPHTRRASNTVVCADWMALGFQGNDPTTDFRSLGLLGLYQLVYFSLHRTPRAHMVLAELSKPGKYYPFAVIGINISQFVMELFNEHRLHRMIFDIYLNFIMS